MDKPFFEQGETIEQFLKNMQSNQEKFADLLDECILTPEWKRALETLPADLKVVVIAEDWSGDVLYNAPVLFRLAQEAGWDVRLFRRDKYPDLIIPYRKDGLYHSIPVFVFYDADFSEVAHWIERPAVATQTIDDESLKLRRRLREDHKDEWRQETIKEILTLLE
jgi:hypothetical protein